jgi:hypothetical protein
MPQFFPTCRPKPTSIFGEDRRAEPQRDATGQLLEPVDASRARKCSDANGRKITARVHSGFGVHLRMPTPQFGWKFACAKFSGLVRSYRMD